MILLIFVNFIFIENEFTSDFGNNRVNMTKHDIKT